MKLLLKECVRLKSYVTDSGTISRLLGVLALKDD